MPMSPIERKAALKSAATLKGHTVGGAAQTEMGCSAQHLTNVMDDPERGSLEIRERFAEYVGLPYEKVWGKRPAASAA